METRGPLAWVPEWVVKLLAATLLAGSITWAATVQEDISILKTSKSVLEAKLDATKASVDRMEAKLDAALIAAVTKEKR